MPLHVSEENVRAEGTKMPLPNAEFIRAILTLLLDEPRKFDYIRKHFPAAHLPKSGVLHHTRVENIIKRGMASYSPPEVRGEFGTYHILPLGRQWHAQGGPVPPKLAPALAETATPPQAQIQTHARHESLMAAPQYVPPASIVTRPGAMDAYNIPTLESGERRPYRPPQLLSTDVRKEVLWR